MYLRLRGKVRDRQLVSAQMITWSMFICTPIFTHSCCGSSLALREGARGWVLVVIGAIRHAVRYSDGPQGALRGTLALF